MVQIKSLNSDKSDLEELLKVTKSIETLYKKLYRLEISGKYGSKEYQITMNYLKIALEVEHRVYQKMKLSYDKCIRLMNILNIQNKVDENVFNAEYVLFDTEYCMIDDRILSHLKDILIENKHIFNREFFPSYEFTIEQSLRDEDGQIFASEIIIPTDDEILEGIRFDELFNFKINQIFIFFAQRYMKENKNSDFANTLLELKYKLSLFNKKIENKMVFNNFKILKHDIFNKSFSSFSPNEDQDDYDYAFQLYANDLMQEHIDEILEITNYSYYKNKEAAMIRALYLESILYLYDKNLITTLKDEYNRSMTLEENQKIKKRRSYKLIQNAFENARNYKETSHN